MMEALTRMIMRVWTPHHLPPLLPCFHHTLRQPILHTTMNSRSSGAIPVTRQGTSRGTVLVCLKALKDKKGLNSKGGTEHRRMEAPPKQPNGAVEGTPPTK